MASVAPHDEARAGPVPALVSAIRQDNKQIATELLRLSPYESSSATTAHGLDGDASGADEHADTNVANADALQQPVRFRQRLVFANEGLRSLFFRNILSDDKAPGKKKKRTGGTSSVGAAHGSDEEDPPPPRGLGIVGTRILARPRATEDSQVGLQSSSSLYPDLVAPGAVSGPSDAFSSLVEDPRDETDGADVVVYFLRADPLHTRAAARRLKLYARNSSRGAIRHRIVYLPRGTALCDRILLDEGVLPLESVTVHSLPIDMIPLDSDVFSLERSDVLRRAEVEGVPSDPITDIARSLVTLQDCTGTVGRMQALGPMAEAVLQRSMAMRLDDFASENFGSGAAVSRQGSDAVNPADGPTQSQVDAMIIIDRKVDMVTPMMTPLTYEGLLDEFLGIDCGLVKVKEDVIEPPEDDGVNRSEAGPTKRVSVALNDLDTLFAEVRDQHVEKFGSFLQQQAQALKETHSDFANKDRDLSEIHQFVKQIPIFTQNLRSLTHHILLAEHIKGDTEETGFRQRWQTERSMVESDTCYDTIEDMIAGQEPPFRVLRLLCLQSLTGGGIKSSRLDSFKREVVQTYGYEFVIIFNHLEKTGLLRRKETIFAMESASPFAVLRKHLSLINAEVSTIEPDDISYVSSGYAPLTARLVEVAVTMGWSGKEEALRELPGRLVDISQRDPPEDLASAMKKSTGTSLGALARSGGWNGGTGKKHVLIVYYVGGVTFMEIAALRLLSKRESFPYSILICTTKVVSGKSLLQSLS